MSAVLENPIISEGYPIDGKLFEPPQQSRALEEPRYVVFLGSLIEPQTALDRPWTKFGGMELSNPCLRYVKNFIMKGRIVPILRDTYDLCTIEYWDKATGKDASYYERPLPQGYHPPLQDETGKVSAIRRMMGKMARPGEQMDTILNGSENIFGRQRRGVVQLPALTGQPYSPDATGLDPTILEINRTIFPKFPFMPVLLSEIERLLDDARIHSSLRTSIIDPMSQSLAQFTDYASATIEQTNYKMRESGGRSEAGYIWRYTDMDFLLAEQLGVTPLNVLRQPAQQSDSELQDMFKQWLAISLEEKQAIAASRVAIDGTAVPPAAPISQDGYPGQSGYSGFSGAVVASDTCGFVNIANKKCVLKTGHDGMHSDDIAPFHQAATETTTETPTLFICEACNQEFDTASGRSLHIRRWCKAGKTE